MVTKFGTKLAITGLRKRFLRDFCTFGGFWGWAIKCCQSHFPPTDPRCHGNEIWDKIGYNSACVRNFCKIFEPVVGFRGWAIECCQTHSPTDPRGHGNEIWNKSLRKRYLRDFLHLWGVFGNGPSNAANCILP